MFYAFQDSLLSILQMVLVPSPSSESGDSFHSVLSGAVYESAMVSQPVSPFFMNHKNGYGYLIIFLYIFDSFFSFIILEYLFLSLLLQWPICGNLWTSRIEKRMVISILLLEVMGHAKLSVIHTIANFGYGFMLQLLVRDLVL